MVNEENQDDGWREDDEPLSIDLAKIEQAVRESLAGWEDLEACDGSPKRRKRRGHLRLA